MSIEVHTDKIGRNNQSIFILVDFVMLGLVVVNLIWIIFDSLFGSDTVHGLLFSVFPDFTLWYQETLHADFILYDLIFVSIFIVELLVRWAFAVANKTYHRWFFYPFVHWYDVLGCVPVGSFRFLRLLRVVSILYRLQKYGIVDMSKTYPYRFVVKYFKVLVEEVSDRVVVNVLEGVQSEIKAGTPVVHRITREVLLPRKGELVEWMAGRLTELAESSYDSRQDEVRGYVDDLITEAVQRNDDLSKISKIPFMGGVVSASFENTISDIVFNVLDQIVDDLKGDESTGLIHEMSDVFVDSVAEPKGEFNETIKAALLDSIDVIKEEVKIQQWKLDSAPY